MSKKVHYHPLTILLHILSALKAWIPFIVIGIIRNGFKDGWETLLIFGGAAMLLSMWACVKYFFESYTIDADKMVIYEGIIRKKEIEVTYERMQAIKQRQWFFLVPFHVVSLQIETAGGESKPEFNIPAIPIRVFNEIEHYRQHANDKQEKNFPEQQADEAVIEKSPLYEEQTVKYQLTNRQIFLFGITDLSVFMGIFVVLLTIERFMSKEWVDEVADVTISAVQTGGLFVVAFGILFMVVAMLFAMIKSMITYYHFKVSYFEKTLTIERGLLEKHVQKIPLNKVQGIRIKQNILRRLLGISSVELILAGGQEQKENADNTAKVLLLPIISESELYPVLQMIYADWQMAKPTIQAVSRGRWFYFSRWSIAVLLPLAIISFFFYWWLGTILLLGLLFVIATDLLNSHNQGLAFLSESRLCIQNYQYFTKVQTFIDRAKVQSIEETSTPFLYRKDLAHLSLQLREGNGRLNVKLRYMKGKDIQRVTRFFRSVN